MSRIVLLAACVACLALPASAVSPNPQDLAIPAGDLLRAKSLIPRLGSEQYLERENAERELAKMGRLAGPVLREAIVVNSDPEVRQRVARLLPKADAADLKARTEAFLADADGRYEHSMPGWAQFRRFAGVDIEILGVKLGSDATAGRQARELFVEMIKSKPTTALLAAIESGGEDLGKSATERRYQMWLDMNPGVFGGMVNGSTTPKQPTLADFTALLVAETLLEGKTSPRIGPFFVSTSQFIHSPAINAAIRGTSPHSAVVRRILAGWFGKLSDVNELQQIAYQVTQYNLKEALPAMRKAVTMNGSPVHLRAQAIGAVAKLGGKSELPLLKKLIEEDTTVQANRFPNKMDLQIRDIALAMAILVTDQDPKAYGYELQQPLNEQIKYQYWTFAFRSKEKRDEALAKWKDWEKNQEKK